MSPTSPVRESDARSSARRTALRERVESRFRASADAATRFFEAHAEAVSRACLDMAERFAQEGRLLVFGSGAESTDAQHVAVEFVHPVLVGKRALPAIALTGDVATLTGVSRGGAADAAFPALIQRLGRPADIAMSLSRGRPTPGALRALGSARAAGLLAISLEGEVDGPAVEVAADHRFVVPSADPLVVQEVQETLYHVIWELVHVFFEQRVVA